MDEGALRGGRTRGPRGCRRQYLRALEWFRPDAAVVGTGSHIDAIPNAGKYDGVVGVLGGLEAIRALQQSGFRPQAFD